MRASRSAAMESYTLIMISAFSWASRTSQVACMSLSLASYAAFISLMVAVYAAMISAFWLSSFVSNSSFVAAMES